MYRETAFCGREIIKFARRVHWSRTCEHPCSHSYLWQTGARMNMST
jgi:hypothetical protein